MDGVSDVKASFTACRPTPHRTTGLRQGLFLPCDFWRAISSLAGGLAIGRENVLFVCGTDEHGSTSELSALRAGKTIRELVDSVHDTQKSTLDRFHIGLDTYSGTSRPDCFPIHAALSQDILRKLIEEPESVSPRSAGGPPRTGNGHRSGRAWSKEASDA